MKRREFLKSAGCFVATASVAGLTGCGDEKADAREKTGTYQFREGVASGDPRETSVMLWTRVTRTDAKAAVEPIDLVLEVSSSKDFAELVLQKELSASEASDFTVRVLVEELKADETYYYRFVAGSDESRTGRTRTAPKANADKEARFAWLCCQDYQANFWGAYRQLLNDDEAAPAAEQIQFVLHIGDFIYETRSAGFMLAVDDDLAPRMLKNADGEMRLVPEFPSGGGMIADGVNFAQTVDDYRHVYKTYLHDENLQEARARWPFICVWDDHEFSDDCWQSQTNYTRDDGFDEASQKRRVSASQAWFEYIPAALDEAEATNDVDAQAKSFQAVKVKDVKFTDPSGASDDDNQKAISAITIYRSLRWGKHVDLVLTDNRSYRSDHALDEGETKSDLLAFHPRAALAKDAVNIADAGMTANGGKPPEMAGNYLNTRKDQPPGTVLGEKQKAWWKDVMLASDATFRIWGNSIPLLRILLDASDVDLIPNDLLLSPDAWDGYNTERKELMKFLVDNEIANVVSLSGDHHATYAGVVMDDYDAAAPKPVMVDLVAPGIASNSQFHEVAGAFDGAIDPNLAEAAAPVKQLIVYDSTKLGGDEKAVVNLNTLIRYGSHAANVAAETHDLAEIEAARDPKINSHLRYADARSYGYGLCGVDGDGLFARLVCVERSFEDLGKESPKIRCAATFQVPRVDSIAEVDLPEPMITGKKPFPLA